MVTRVTELPTSSGARGHHLNLINSFLELFILVVKPASAAMHHQPVIKGCVDPRATCASNLLCSSFAPCNFQQGNAKLWKYCGFNKLAN